MASLKVALVQLEQSPVEGPEDKAKAAQRAADLLRSAPEADIYVLPELAPVGYNDAVFRNLQLLAEEELCEPGTCRHALAEVARERRCFICYGVPGKQGESDFNIRQVVLDDTGSVVACYNKCHLADFGDGAESKYFKPGGRLCYFECRGFRIGLLICADMRFSELCRELAVGRGCEILLQPAAFARDVSYASWQSFVECRALENQVYWAGINYAGSYFGGSMWCPPWVDGSDKVVSRMGIEEQITVHEATKEELASTRESFRFLRQRKDRAAYGEPTLA
ncbi:Nit2 [Symbiodinium sp. CCMP2592]|nr:Nit2 [Symbiodinium sp. CCMP2592]